MSDSKDRLSEYVKSNCVAKLGVNVGTGLLAGGFVGAAKAAYRDNPIPRHLTKTIMRQTVATVAGPALLFAGIGGVYSAVSCTARSVRGVDDSWNAIIGGAAAGTLIGFHARSTGMVLGGAVALGTAAAFAQMLEAQDKYRKAHSGAGAPRSVAINRQEAESKGAL